MSHNNSGDAWVGEVIGAVLMWLWLFLVGAWLLSQWLTELLFRHVLNPMLDYALDRNDGLIILLSAGLWGTLFPSLLTPLLDISSPNELLQAILVLVGLGLAWGISIGFWILLKWWSEIDQREATYEPVQMLGEPIQVASLPPADDQQSLPSSSLPSNEELEADLEEVFGQEEVREGV
jgi:hypothetical protein